MGAIEGKGPPSGSAGSTASIAPTPLAVLEKSSLPAAGRHETLLNVHQFGRFSVSVESSQGTSLQIVDRMAGPGETKGVAGESDGRIDLFLDRGAYKVIATGPDKGKGDARLSVRPFRERSVSPAILVELRPVEDRLEDLEQISYAMSLPMRRRVIVEASGRNLADIRLWRSGSWLVDAEPKVETAEPTPGRPMTSCRLAADLEPGDYVLTAYGGPAKSWAAETGEHPFHLRYGLPSLGEAGRKRFMTTPFGTDRFLVPWGANFFRLELPAAGVATLRVEEFDPASPFALSGTVAEITKKRSPPATEIELPPGSDEEKSGGKLRLVTITTDAEQPYLLTHFERRDIYSFQGSGDYWISTVRTGNPSDDVDSTVLVTRSEPQTQEPKAEPGAPPKPVQPFLAQTAELDVSHGWARRCNLLGTLKVFFHVADAGKYRVFASGVSARFRMEPFLVSYPRDYQAPPLQESPYSWDLDSGYYILTAEPNEKGILEVEIRPSGMLDSLLTLLGRGGTPGSPEAPRTSVIFPRVPLEANRSYLAFHNEIPEVKIGYVLRPLPLDLGLPLPLAPRPGEKVTIPFTAREAGTVKAEGEDGSLLPLSLDGAPPAPSPSAGKGLHTLSLTVAGERPVFCSISFRPQIREPGAPPLASTRAPAAPFPTLTEKAPVFLDLERQAGSTFLLRADEPGLYSLQSTGLLSTEGNLRTRIVTSLDREQENGAGRNFLIQQYLREGEYQLSVSARGKSRGHLGLRLERTQLLDGGELKDGVPARVLIPAGHAAAYRFSIPEPGKYRLEAFGTQRSFRCRLENEEGWPLEAPGGDAQMTRSFEAGHYRLVLLPGAVEARSVTLLERVRPPLKFDGHGPHELPLNTSAEQIWREPAEGEPRAPDVWKILVPAPVDAAIDLNGEMQGTLTAIDSEGREPLLIPPGRIWKGPLQKGEYRLDVLCSRRNDRVQYRLEIRTEQMVEGTTREVTSPATLEISVGREGLVNLESWGRSDVRARLLDAQGHSVGSDDDRPDDWNFQIARSLPPGRYRLEVEPVGGDRTKTRVKMTEPPQVEENPLQLPGARDFEPGERVHQIPLQLKGGGNILLVAAESSEPIACALEVFSAEAWRIVGSGAGRVVRLAAPLVSRGESSTRHRLVLWTPEGQGGKVHLTAAEISAPSFTEAQLRKGIRLSEAEGIRPPMAVASVTLERPGLFRMEHPESGISWSAREGKACEESADRLLPFIGKTVWFAADASRSSNALIRASRVVLDSGSDRGVSIRLVGSLPAACDLSPSPGGPVLVLATSRAGQPGVSIEDEAKQAPAVPRSASMAAGAGSAIGVALGAKHPVALLWPGAGPAESLEVRVEQMGFPAPSPSATSWGVLTGSLTGTESKAYTLPAGAKHLRLALGAGVVGVLSDGSAISSVHWSGDSPAEEELESTADRLTLLHTRPGADRFSAEILPFEGKKAPISLATGEPYERFHEAAGKIRLEVAPSPGDGEAGFRLHVRVEGIGADAAEEETPLFIGRDGRIARGGDLETGGVGGALLVPHLTGLVLAWMGEGKDDVGGPCGIPAPGEKVSVAPPAVVPLRGETQSLLLSPAGPSMVQVRVSAPLITCLKRKSAPPEVEIHPSGCVFNAFFSGGPEEIALHAIPGSLLSGFAELSTTPVTTVREGLGPETMILAGEARIFSFSVGRNGAVGIGVRSNSDKVECTLRGSAGNFLGSGLVQMKTLDPGTYLLDIRVPKDGRPTTVRPALAGLEPPGTGPPEEVIRSYLKGEEEQPAGTVAPQPPGTGQGLEGEPAPGEQPPEEPSEPPDDGDEGD
jgi:hypothetical protein